MQMNPNIILAGQTPDVAGSAMNGVALASGINDVRRTNALRDLYQQQGAGIMAGDQGALNALAGFDPAAALGIQSARQDMTFAANREDRAAQEFKMALDQMSQSEAAAEAEKIRAAIGKAAAAQTPEQWDAYVMSIGKPELAGQFQNREAILLQYMDLTDYIETEKGLKELRSGQEPTAAMQTLMARAEAAGLKPGTPEYQQFMFNNGAAPEGMKFSTNADGGVTFEQGPGVTDGRPESYTDAQSKNIIYYTRAEGALADFNPVADAMADPRNAVGGAIPLAGNYLVTPEYQQAETAGKEFLAAILRKDTGAAITTQEMQEYGDIYFPKPGDTPERLQQKARARARAMEALRAGMGAKEIIALSQSDQPGPGATTPQTAPVQNGESVLTEDDLKYLGVE